MFAALDYCPRDSGFNENALADKGYFNGEEIAACETAGIGVYVPKPATSNSRAQGRFDKDEFIYDHGNDHYVCRWTAPHAPHDD